MTYTDFKMDNDGSWWETEGESDREAAGDEKWWKGTDPQSAEAF